MAGGKTPGTAAAVGMAVLKAPPGLLLLQVGVTTPMTGLGQWLWDAGADFQPTTNPACLAPPALPATLIGSIVKGCTAKKCHDVLVMPGHPAVDRLRIRSVLTYSRGFPLRVSNEPLAIRPSAAC